MPFYQNPFDTDYRGSLLLGDRQYVINFKVPANVNTTQVMMAWNPEPYNVSSDTTLTFKYSFDSGRTYSSLAVNVSTAAASAAAATCHEIAAALNAHAAWSALYLAEVTQDKDFKNYLRVKALRPRSVWKTYILNTSAEKRLRFNKKAGVAEAPAYFDKDLISNASRSNSVGMLVKLDAGDSVDQVVISEAGFTPGDEQEDYQLLQGQSGLFQFQKITTDSGNGHRVDEIIEFPAGAVAGMLGKKTVFVYDGGNSTDQPNKVFELPHVITSSDITDLTPP